MSALDPDFFNKIGIEYEEAYSHNPGLIQFAKHALSLISEHGSVLDMGCGTGKPISSIIADSGRRVHGIDVSETMVSLSRKNVPHGIFENVNMLNYQPTAPFDAIFACLSLFSITISQLGPFMKKVNGWLVPNGFLFIVMMTSDGFEPQPGFPEDDDEQPRILSNKLMGKIVSSVVHTRRGWILLLQQSGFEILSTNTIEFQPPEHADCDAEQHYYITAQKTSTV